MSLTGLINNEGLWNPINKVTLGDFKNFPVTHIHLFTYSRRDNTPSASMKEIVPKDIAKIRYKELENIVKKSNLEFRKNIKPLDILVEEQKDNLYYGYDQFYNRVEIKSDIDIVGNWLNIDNYIAEDNINVTEFI